jgi:hypothetical protein
MQEKMMLKCLPFKIILLHIQRLNSGKGVYELEVHVGQEALSSNSLRKLGFAKKIPHAQFSNRLLKNI